MSSTKILAAALLAATTLSTAAFANDAMYTPNSGLYLTVEGGYNMPTSDDGTEDNAAVWGGAIGYRVNPNLRVEVEGLYRNNDYSEDASALGGGTINGEVKVSTAMLNAYYDFKNSSAFTPYLGAGVGMAYGKIGAFDPVGTIGLSGDDTVFAYQLSAGVAYDVAPNIALTLGYHYLDTSDMSFNGSIGGVPVGSASDDYKAHEVLAGVRYSF